MPVLIIVGVCNTIDHPSAQIYVPNKVKNIVKLLNLMSGVNEDF